MTPRGRLPTKPRKSWTPAHALLAAGGVAAVGLAALAATKRRTPARAPDTAPDAAVDTAPRAPPAQRDPTPPLFFIKRAILERQSRPDDPFANAVVDGAFQFLRSGGVSTGEMADACALALNLHDVFSQEAARSRIMVRPGAPRVLSRALCSALLFNVITGAYAEDDFGGRGGLSLLSMLRPETGAHAIDPSQKAAKLACFLSYWVYLFRVRQSSAERYKKLLTSNVSFSMRRLDPNEFHDGLAAVVDVQRCAVEFREGDMSAAEDGSIFVDFANDYIGGGVLGNGSVQEETEFCRRPECIVARLLCERMGPEECIFIQGTIETSATTFIERPFRYLGVVDVDAAQPPHVIAAIDAISFGGTTTLADVVAPENILRDLRKAYLAALGPLNWSPTTAPVVLVTGAWGAGAFYRGPARLKPRVLELKTRLQIVAATMAFRRRAATSPASSSSSHLSVASLWESPPAKVLFYMRQVALPEGPCRALLPEIFS